MPFVLNASFRSLDDRGEPGASPYHCGEEVDGL